MKGIINYIKDNEFRMIVLKNKINIVNYEDLLSMHENEILLLTTFGKITIKGKNLSVTKLLNKELLIIGELTNIEIGE